MRSGQAQILVGTKKDASNSNDLILYIDPIDPTAQLQEEPLSQFLEKWGQKIIIVAPKSETASLDREYGWGWFFPELARFKGALFLLL